MQFLACGLLFWAAEGASVSEHRRFTDDALMPNLLQLKKSNVSNSTNRTKRYFVGANCSNGSPNCTYNGEQAHWPGWEKEREVELLPGEKPMGMPGDPFREDQYQTNLNKVLGVTSHRVANQRMPGKFDDLNPYEDTPLIGKIEKKTGRVTPSQNFNTTYQIRKALYPPDIRKTCWQVPKCMGYNDTCECDGAKAPCEINSCNIWNHVGLEKGVILVWYEPDCKVCKDFEPTFDELRKTFNKDSSMLVAKINAANNTGLADDYNITELPTTLFLPAKCHSSENGCWKKNAKRFFWPGGQPKRFKQTEQAQKIAEWAKKHRDTLVTTKFEPPQRGFTPEGNLFVGIKAAKNLPKKVTKAGALKTSFLCTLVGPAGAFEQTTEVAEGSLDPTWKAKFPLVEAKRTDEWEDPNNKLTFIIKQRNAVSGADDEIGKARYDMKFFPNFDLVDLWLPIALTNVTVASKADLIQDLMDGKEEKKVEPPALHVKMQWNPGQIYPGGWTTAI